MAAATLLEAYPMAQRGEVGRAISLAAWSSVLGGIFGLFVLISIAPLLAPLILRLGPPEYALLSVFGLTAVASLSPRATAKGIYAAAFGLFLATTGTDLLTSSGRFTFGQSNLLTGVGLVPVLLGVYAVPQVFDMLEQWVQVKAMSAQQLRTSFPSWPEFRRLWRVNIKSSAIGVVVGMLPGAGADIAAWVAYAEARRSSRRRHEFGKGSEEGLVAAEAANNSVIGGALVPTLTLGIPGDPLTAILLGVLAIHGLTPGPLLFERHSGLLATLFTAMFIGNILLLFMSIYGSRAFVHAVRIPRGLLVPMVLFWVFLGVYGIESSIFDVWVMLIMGAFGYFIRKLDIPPAPIILGLVLGPNLEGALRRTLALSGGSLAIFVTRPLSIVLICLIIAALVVPIILFRREAQLTGIQESS
jgi:putative tricarboxylic transport membrane protein